MRKRFLAGVFAGSALVLMSIAPVAAKPGGVNPIGTCSTPYLPYTIQDFADAYPDEWANRQDHVIAVFQFVDHNGNGIVCAKDRPSTSTTFDQFAQANIVDDNKKTGNG